MKKVIVALMFVFAAGLFSTTVSAMTYDNIEVVHTEKDKDKKKKKKKAKKGEAKECTSNGEKKACCSGGGSK
jgi:anionic cell wall polymer biosynthesis LytR-Cps2A-Psr (LCP) family protein